MNFIHTTTPITELILSKIKNGQLWYDIDGLILPSIDIVLQGKQISNVEAMKFALQSKQKNKSKPKLGHHADIDFTSLKDTIIKYLNNTPINVKNDINNQAFNRLKPFINSIDRIQLLNTVIYSDSLKLAGLLDCVCDFKGDTSVVLFGITKQQSTADEDVNNQLLTGTALAIMYNDMFKKYVDKVVVINVQQKSNTLPLIIKRDVEAYIPSLLKRIHQFNGK